MMCDCKQKMPYPSKCWPGDKDFLDGAVELVVPPSTALRAYWDADLLDINGVRPGTIISIKDAFQVRFRVELVGDLWHCICGDWCFDFGFTAIGAGSSFDLSAKLPAGTLELKNWQGCKSLCIEKVATVPAGSVPAEHCGTLYDVGAKFSLHCCDRERPILVGYETKCQVEFY